LFLALALSFLVSISVPYVVDFDVVRTIFKGTVSGDGISVSEVRLGIWGYCARYSSDFVCDHTGLAYQYTVSGGANSNTEYVRPSWTRGLVMSPVATAFILVSFLASFSSHLTILLASSLLAFMGALVTIIFMAINIALFVYVRSKMNDLGTSPNTNFGPGFWMSLAVFILCMVAGFIVCFGHRRERNARKADNYVANSTTGYGARRNGWRRFVPGRRRAVY